MVHEEILGILMNFPNREEERDEDMAYMRTQIDILTKHIVSKSKNLNVVGQQKWYKDQDINLDEEVSYLATKKVSEIITRETGYQYGNAGRNYSREGHYDRPANREHKIGRTDIDTEMIAVVTMFPQEVETEQVVLPPGLSWNTCCQGTKKSEIN